MMVKCSKCGRENDDSFTFCLDCGSELKPSGDGAPEAAPPAPASSPATPAAETPPAPATGTATASAQTLDSVAKPTPADVAPAPAAPEPSAAPPAEEKPAPAPSSAEEKIACPKCDGPVALGATFCSNCGHRIGEDVAKGRTMFMHVATPDAEQKPKARLILIKPDGTEGTVFSLASEKTTIGRSAGIIMFPKDPYVSPKHAELVFKEGKLGITDLGSLNGIYHRSNAESQIFPGTYFRIGRQLLRLEVPGEFQPMEIKTPEGDDSTFWGSPAPQVWARLVQVLEGGKIGEIHLLTQPEVLIGREEGEIRFPEDGFISSKHCMLNNKEGDCYLRDLGSSNGTYLRIRETQALETNDRVQIGNQVLKIDIS
jgi:pSer/pThr/pTyr-binding forkhead associated (FHA) protein